MKNCYSITNEQIIENCKSIKFFKQKVDNFNYDSNQQNFFQHRYIMDDKYFKGKGSPIMFCTGYEADIVSLCHENFINGKINYKVYELELMNSLILMPFIITLQQKFFYTNKLRMPIMFFAWQLSEKHGALVVFAEHRYFGESLPFGNQSHIYPNHNYLQLDQVLKDYANLVKFIKNAENSPVIAFGGSYGGMLAAWFRIKYPHLVEGSLASSAPVSQEDCYDYGRILTDVLRNTDQECPLVVSKVWNVINKMSKSQNGLDKLGKTFKICGKISPDEIPYLKRLIEDAVIFIVQSNYHHETNIVKPLPALPVKVFCNRVINSLTSDNLEDDDNILNSVSNGIQLFYNYTGETKCIENEYSRDALSMEILVTFHSNGCKERFFTYCFNGKTDLFEESQTSFEDYYDSCKSRLNITPVKDSYQTTYAFTHDEYKSFSNIIFSNGCNLN
ncbi:lysosomal Pro-X carboxypeptidase isoform X1 [Brachionus plicatilis]|uniref:Lysosomal Pro-X carboxypeptidase isoform X1 n=1 Tax=Brachionus plicatilis TaxID=10195 RepID=A0A3M7RGM4_BRAPC|nr:lysosomal Pro-X carboxypeptidase isoform X1 [Brachionus plicatilis]